MNYDKNEFCVCPYDRENMAVVGEETGQNWESVYLYECQKCHKIHHSTIKYLKSFEMTFPPSKEKVQFT